MCRDSELTCQNPLNQPNKVCSRVKSPLEWTTATNRSIQRERLLGETQTRRKEERQVNCLYAHGNNPLLLISKKAADFVQGYCTFSCRFVMLIQYVAAGVFPTVVLGDYSTQAEYDQRMA